MTREEIDYLEEYLKAVQAGADVTDGVKEAVLLSAMAGDADAKHRLIEIFLPQVAEIAKLYAGQGVFLEDLIGEGNVALTMAAEMLDCAQNAKEAEGTIASMIMPANATQNPHMEYARIFVLSTFTPDSFAASSLPPTAKR